MAKPDMSFMGHVRGKLHHMTGLRRVFPMALGCLLTSAVFAADQRGAFRVGAVEAAPGTRVSGFLEVPAGADAGTELPVTVIHGQRPGPVLALVAGTHGAEYPAITALQRLRTSLDPASLGGSLILVHIANPASFRARSVYRNPVDGRNLNRVFPGAADGTQSERIAHVITREVIERADYLVDMHAGDGNEALQPFVYMPVTGNAELDAAARGMAIAFGLSHIVIDEITLPSPDQSVYTDHTALARGIPAITTETGQLASNDEGWIALAERGIENLMRHLGMLEGELHPPRTIVWLADYQVVKSPHTGVFRAMIGPGDRVEAGAVLGILMDDFGDRLGAVTSPTDGLVNYVLGTPPVSAGEPVAMVSRVRQ
jgi:predicted deacylase